MPDRRILQMEEKKDTPPPIVDQVKSYVETQLELTKLEAVEKGSKFLAGFVVDIIIGVCFVLGFLFVSFALALLISHFLGSYWAGFGLMALLYLIVSFIVINRKDKIRPALTDLFIRNFFK